MADPSFSSRVHPCDSSFFPNTMQNDEQNGTDSNDLDPKTQQQSKDSRSSHLLFDDPVNLYEYQSILPNDSSSSMLSLASRSVPSSRRNSGDKNGISNTNQPLESLLNSKLHLELGDQNAPSIPDPNVFSHHDDRFRTTTTTTTTALRSSLATADVTSIQPAHPLPLTNNSTLTYVSPPSTLEGADTVFQQRSHQLSLNPSVHQYHPSSSIVPLNNFSDQLRTDANKTPYTTPSKPWSQHFDHPTSQNDMLLHSSMMNPSMEMNNKSPYYLPASTASRNDIASISTASYNPTPRRSSYGWQRSDAPRYQGFSPDLSGIKTRLTTSQSHSDLRGSSINHNGIQQTVGPTTAAAASFGFYNGSSAVSGNGDYVLTGINNDPLAPLCPNFIQYGYCVLGDQCRFTHPILPSSNDVPGTRSSAPRSQQQVQQSFISTQTHPLNALYNSSAPLLNKSGAVYPFGSGTTTLSTFPVGASSSVYGRSSGVPSYPSNHHHTPQHPLHKQQNDSAQTRRSSTDQDSSRFTNANLKDFEGHLYELAKDQNGCRFLQRKLDDMSQNIAVKVIYDEIHDHFVELMTNSFGNYLCQKLLERCGAEQRDRIVDIVAPDIVSISLNMHGTRAVQKLIECLTSPDQIRKITSALNPSVVPLIKDLNGNHVIQKCLHRLSADHRQFIYDAITNNCIEVATHKHGCCVLQRCIDYASPSQKAQLVAEITRHALPLVQDQYGNYVVQYVLEIGDSRFSDGLIRQFVGHTCHLSAQKFSSNVIEKIIRLASPDTRRLLLAEFIDPPAMEMLLRDSFANYVVQTSLDYAEPDQRAELIDCIRPLLASVRSTPYGKRIHGKISREQQRLSQQHQQQSLDHSTQQQTQNRRSTYGTYSNIPI